MEPNEYYVYIYMHPDTLDIIYVGKGKGIRNIEHLQDAVLYVENTRFYIKLREMINDQKYPIIRRIENKLTEQEAIDREAELIESIGRIEDGGTLYNILLRGKRRGEISEETRLKLSRVSLGRKRSSETRLKISQALIGNKNSSNRINNKETKLKMSLAAKGRVITKEQKIKMSKAKKKLICSYDLATGKIYKIYAGTVDVTKDGFNVSGVQACINGHQDRYYNRGWRFLTEEEKEIYYGTG